MGPLKGVVHVRHRVGTSIEGLEELSVGEGVSVLHALDAGLHLTRNWSRKQKIHEKNTYITAARQSRVTGQVHFRVGS